MTSAVINTREDLDAIAGTPEHAAFMAMLRGSLWRLEKDDSASEWRAVEDNSTIARFGFIRADFPGAAAPELPAYVPPPSDVPQVVTMRQARLALLASGLLDDVNEAIAGMTGGDGEAARVEWEYAQDVRRDSSLVKAMAHSMLMSDADLDSLFKSAAVI